jgi:hypothetical protein
MLSAHGCAASASVAAFARQGAVVLPPVLSRFIKATMAAALALCLVQPVSAQQAGVPFAIKYNGTLKKIDESGVVRIGHRENSAPFAFLDKNSKPIGYSLDLCEIVVEEIVAELGKDIRTEYRPVTPENRFDLVTSGQIDLECGSTTNNAERRKIVAFSPTIFVTGTASGAAGRNPEFPQPRQDSRAHTRERSRPLSRLAERQNLAIKFVFVAIQRVVPMLSASRCIRKRRRAALRDPGRNKVPRRFSRRRRLSPTPTTR